MSRVRGAVVVQRPDLTQTLHMLSPAPGVDFVQTLQSYFSISESSLLRYDTHEVHLQLHDTCAFDQRSSLEAVGCALGLNPER